MDETHPVRRNVAIGGSDVLLAIVAAIIIVSETL